MKTGIIVGIIVLASCETTSDRSSQWISTVVDCDYDTVDLRATGETAGDGVPTLIYEGEDVVFDFETSQSGGRLVLEMSDATLLLEWHAQFAVQARTVDQVQGEFRATEGSGFTLLDGVLLLDDQECRQGRFKFASVVDSSSEFEALLGDGIEGCFAAPVPETSRCPVK